MRFFAIKRQRTFKLNKFLFHFKCSELLKCIFEHFKTQTNENIKRWKWQGLKDDISRFDFKKQAGLKKYICIQILSF